ncbi:MAG TPA: Ig-like domain repeat protein [Solirubrobacteraceae bacterium]|nr:Ig-like domain repeat protein [Solirubrobacteraceae bacterium]
MEEPAPALRALHRSLLVIGMVVLLSAAGWWLLAAPSGAVPGDLVCPAAPTISGTPQLGATLTPSVWTCTGTAPTYTYLWSPDGAIGTTDTLSAADVGQMVTVTVTATDSTGSVSVTSAPVGPVTAPPVNTPAPTITGTVLQGDTLTAHPGTWGGYPAPTYTYSWSDGTTGLTDTLSAADVGKAVTFTETASNSIGSATASVKTAAVKGPPVNTSPPTITGLHEQGATLTANPGTWSGFPVPTYTYAWSDGATGPTDTLAAVDVGQTVTVTVTAHNSVAPVPPPTATASVGPVTPPASLQNISLPTISGTAQQGAMLTANPGGWSGTLPISYSYAWSDGTTGPTDTLSAADVGTYVSVTVTASNVAGGLAVTSASLGPVSPLGPVATTTALAASPNSAVTNQAVILVATVTSINGAAAPSGSIAFKNGGNAISGCANVAVAPTAQSVTVTCQASFAAGTPELTAVFTPGPGSNITPSASPTNPVTVARDSTSTSLDASSTAYVGAKTTYTATVAAPPTRPGPIGPTGSVQFLDRGQPISGCLSQPLSSGGATCTITYASRGTHSITARYSGDRNFTGSATSAAPVNVQPPQARGALTSTMQWTFFYTPTYTTVMALVVNGASGATVVVKCQGKGCPFAKRAAVVSRTRRCGTNGKRTCSSNGTVNLTQSFVKHHLRTGARIIITITRPSWIGKYYSFTVRARRAPRITINCLAPGGTRPGAGC